MGSSPTMTHRFICKLRDEKKLIREYTQNIDCVQAKAGLSTNIQQKCDGESRTKAADCIQLHGSLQYLRCQLCSGLTNWDGLDNITAEGECPPCPVCSALSKNRVDNSKRSSNKGALLPFVVLYDDDSKNNPFATENTTTADRDAASRLTLVLIIGTSLTVKGTKSITEDFARSAHSRNGTVILVNKTPVAVSWAKHIDYWVKWDCDEWVLDLANRIGLDISTTTTNPTHLSPPGEAEESGMTASSCYGVGKGKGKGKGDSETGILLNLETPAGSKTIASPEQRLDYLYGLTQQYVDGPRIFPKLVAFCNRGHKAAWVKDDKLKYQNRATFSEFWTHAGSKTILGLFETPSASRVGNTKGNGNIQFEFWCLAVMRPTEQIPSTTLVFWDCKPRKNAAEGGYAHNILRGTRGGLITWLRHNRKITNLNVYCSVGGTDALEHHAALSLTVDKLEELIRYGNRPFSGQNDLRIRDCVSLKVQGWSL